MHGHAWREHELKILRESWAAGETADIIGARLRGLSRSAVLGKIFRLRLKSNPAKQRRSAATIDPALARRRKSPRRIEQAPPPIQQRATVFDLTNVTCRWPLGRPGSSHFHFCAKPDADLERGIPYCPQHMQRAYTAPPEPKPAPTAKSAALFRWR